MTEPVRSEVSEMRDDRRVSRAQRVETAPAYQATDGAAPARAYASAFQVRIEPADARSAEQWARLIFDSAPPVLRRVIVFGWRFGLGLRLVRSPSSSDVLGWRITESQPDAVTLAARSRLLSARNVIRCQGQELTWTTVVDFRGRAGRLLWLVAAPVHHLIVPFLLGRATRPL